MFDSINAVPQHSAGAGHAYGRLRNSSSEGLSNTSTGKQTTSAPTAQPANEAASVTGYSFKPGGHYLVTGVEAPDGATSNKSIIKGIIQAYEAGARPSENAEPHRKSVHETIDEISARFDKKLDKARDAEPKESGKPDFFKIDQAPKQDQINIFHKDFDRATLGGHLEANLRVSELLGDARESFNRKLEGKAEPDRFEVKAEEKDPSNRFELKSRFKHANGVYRNALQNPGEAFGLSKFSQTA